MPRSRQQSAAPTPSGFGVGEQAKMQRQVEELNGMVNRDLSDGRTRLRGSGR